ncbi:interleukin-17 receptor A [Petromyzon marinus]|uniref:interleukin-17 receptor A n=1 Tax=Petromyzon marinus TaxID=7757 RepID=UPI003F7157FD
MSGLFHSPAKLVISFTEPVMLILSRALVFAFSATCFHHVCAVTRDTILYSYDCSKKDVNCTIQTLPPRDDGSVLWTPGRPLDVVLKWSLSRQGTNASLDAYPTVLTPVLNITWWLPYDDSIVALQGTEVCVTMENENATRCVWFVYSSTPTRLESFSFHGFAVEPYKRYRVDVCNFPKPVPLEPETIFRRNFTLPGCEDYVMKTSTQCILNGSMWSPDISVHLNDSGASVKFSAVNLSRRYNVTLESCGQIHKASVIGGIGKYRQVTFPGVTPTPGCRTFEAKIKPYFDICKDDCKERTMSVTLTDKNSPTPPPPTNKILGKVAIAVTLCLVMTFAMGVIVYCKRDAVRNGFCRPATTVEEEKTEVPVAQLPPKLQPRKVFIVYSNDHKLFRDIVLHFAAFLQSKCGMAVSLDLWEEQKVAKTGRMQWLMQQLDQSKDSAAKVIVLFSRGSQMKWRALCDSTQVEFREDLKSLVGDMYSPALSLICDGIMRPATFEKYIVAYFEDVSSERDIPSFFNVTLKYKLMKNFKELFFRIQDKEQYEPGITYGTHGISAEDYFEEPCGRRLLEAIQAFKRFQKSNPDWFENNEGDKELDKTTWEGNKMYFSAAGIRENIPIFEPNDGCGLVLRNSPNLSNDSTDMLKASLTQFSHESGVSRIENTYPNEQLPLLFVSPAENDIPEYAVHAHYSNQVNVIAQRTSQDMLLNPDDLSGNGSDQQFGQISSNALFLLEGFQRSLVNENSNSDLGECVERPGLCEPQHHIIPALQTNDGPMYNSFDGSNDVHIDFSVPSYECPRELCSDPYNAESKMMKELIHLQQQVLQNSIANI